MTDEEKKLHELADDGPRAYAPFKMADLQEEVDRLQEAEDNLWSYLVDNTKEVFEEIDEVDSARNLIIEVKTKMQKAIE